jgi:hypothetical protein
MKRQVAPGEWIDLGPWSAEPDTRPPPAPPPMPQGAWRCERCGCLTRFEDGRGPANGDPPPGWADLGDGRMGCVRCQRDLVIAAAVEEGESKGLGRGQRRALRQRRLVEFEIRRDPGRPDAAIARVAGCAKKVVSRVREELTSVGGRLTSAPSADADIGCERGSGRNPGARARAEELLLADPTRPTRSIAAEAGCAPRTVVRARAQLEAAGDIPRWRDPGGRRAAR